MISLFEKRLKRMKSELTALKTAHKRGLGTIRFYKYTLEFTSGNTGTRLFYILADIADGEPGNPFVQGLTRSSTGNYETLLYDATSNASSVQVVVESWSNPHGIVCDIISTSQLKNVRVDHDGPIY